MCNAFLFIVSLHWLKKASFISLGAVFALLVSLWCLYMIYSQLTRYFSLHMSWTLSCFVSPALADRLTQAARVMLAGFSDSKATVFIQYPHCARQAGLFGHLVYAASCDGRLSSCCRGRVRRSQQIKSTLYVLRVQTNAWPGLSLDPYPADSSLSQHCSQRHPVGPVSQGQKSSIL